jgi:bifunctional non-homologous end joining protein LigD
MREVWRTSPAHSRKSPPAGFILPCNPTLVDHPPKGPDWLHEVKHDGFRILARKQGTKVTLWSRRGTDLTDRMPQIAKAIRGLPADEALIDGEAVIFRSDGMSDFEALLTRRGGERALLVAFDLLRLDGRDIRENRIEDRRTALKRLAAGADGVLFSESIEGEGALVFAKACELGLEGIVSKRSGSLYRSGASKSWLKTKNTAFART